MLLDAFIQAFEFYQGIPKRVLIDNPKTMVTKIGKGKAREFHPRFLALMNHYLIEPVACTPASGWEKGQVERQVKYLRKEIFTPQLNFNTLEELNVHLRARSEMLATKAHPQLKSQSINTVSQQEKSRLAPLGDTSPVIWGDIGANAQHAFFQLLHQGTTGFYADFITPVTRKPSNEYTKATQQQLHYQQNLNLANCIAQSRALMMGDSVLDWEESSDHPADHLYIGNHQSISIMLEELTPHSFGGLLAMYEHKVYTQAVIWDINPL